MQDTLSNIPITWTGLAPPTTCSPSPPYPRSLASAINYVRIILEIEIRGAAHRELLAPPLIDDSTNLEKLLVSLPVDDRRRHPIRQSLLRAEHAHRSQQHHVIRSLFGC